jgi:hypothetical protein
VAGLMQVRDTLKPQGVLGVWSSGASDAFAGRLRSVGFVVTTHNTRARGRRGPRRTIWTCQRR